MTILQMLVGWVAASSLLGGMIAVMIRRAEQAVLPGSCADRVRAVAYPATAAPEGWTAAVRPDPARERGPGALVSLSHGDSTTYR